MFNSLYIAASGMYAQHRKVEILANNLAHTNTISYKAERVDFQELLYDKIGDVEVGAGVKVGNVERVFTVGRMQKTGNPLDIAINGRGFLRVELPDGRIAYTRDGRLKVKDGELVTVTGGKLGIKIPKGAVNITIEEDGTVVGYLNNEKKVFGKIKLYDFLNPSALEMIGNNMYVPTKNSGMPVEGEPGKGDYGKILSGFIERSNVNLISQMMEMVTAQRAYEFVAKGIEATDQLARMTTQMKRD